MLRIRDSIQYSKHRNHRIRRSHIGRVCWGAEYPAIHHFGLISKGDGGKWQPNYSSLGGNLASSALSNLYFPKSNRGPGLVFSQFAIGTTERVIASVAQEFVLSRLTHRGGHID
jgi:hypothetical protein